MVDKFAHFGTGRLSCQFLKEELRAERTFNSMPELRLFMVYVEPEKTWIDFECKLFEKYTISWIFTLVLGMTCQLKKVIECMLNAQCMWVKG
jgi:hypothetical protein